MVIIGSDTPSGKSSRLSEIPVEGRSTSYGVKTKCSKRGINSSNYPSSYKFWSGKRESVGFQKWNILIYTKQRVDCS